MDEAVSTVSTITATFLIGFILILFILGMYLRPGTAMDEAVSTVSDEFDYLEVEGEDIEERNLHISLMKYVKKHLVKQLQSAIQMPDFGTKLKIVIAFLQVISSFDIVYVIPWPPSFVLFLAKLDFLNLKFFNIPGLALTCIDENIDFLTAFNFAAIFPIVVLISFCIVYLLGVQYIKQKGKKK